jgi:SOUL heme-binding protein
VLRLVKTLVSSVVLAGCTVVGVRGGTEEPGYKLVERLDSGIEVRRYAARTAAETTVQARGRSSNEGRAFSTLANYIFGGNQSRDSIAMTTPVEAATRATQIEMTTPVQASAGQGSYQMRFFLPAGYDAKTAPVPNDSRVRLVDLPEETMAVLRFTGSREDDAVDQVKAQLLANLERSQWKATAEPVALFYDPPWTLPPLRRNEAAVLVARR